MIMKTVYRPKVNRDKNHKAVVEALELAGFTVVDLAMVGGGCPDILVGIHCKSGKRVNVLIEIKRSVSAQVQQDQEVFQAAWKGQETTVYTPQDALYICNQYKTRN